MVCNTFGEHILYSIFPLTIIHRTLLYVEFMLMEPFLRLYSSLIRIAKLGLNVVYASIPIDCFTTKELLSMPSELLFPDLLPEHIPGSELKFYALYQLFICLYMNELMVVAILS